MTTDYRQKDYRDVFKVPNEDRVLPDDFAETMQDLAGFRHLPVHVYREINDGKIYDDTRQGLSDFDTYARDILEFVKQQNDRAGE